MALKIRDSNPNLVADTEVEKLKEALSAKAEHLLVTELPAKIVSLNLLSKMKFKNVKLMDIHQDVNIPVPHRSDSSRNDEPSHKRRRMEPMMMANFDSHKMYTLPNGPAPSNRTLSNLILTIKPHIRQLFEDSNLLKVWISYLIPKIEEGNFDTSVQGKALNEIQKSELKAEQFLDQISEYFVSRAKIVSKVAKYPHIEDYRRAVREMDEKEYLFLWRTTSEVRNQYYTLYEQVTKNLDTIKKPRKPNTEYLY